MITKRVLGKIIIGIAITLAIASIPLFISGTDQITDKLILYTSAYVGDRSIYQYPLQGHSLAISLLLIGLSIVGLIVLKDGKKILKPIIYPVLISIILGITLGTYFASIYSNSMYHFELDFNWTLCFITLGLGVFISLISLGSYFLKK